MDDISSKEIREHFSEYIHRAAYGKERHVVTRNRKRMAAIVPIEDLELLTALEDVIDLDEARKALAEAKEKGTVSWERVKADLGL